MNIDEPKYMKSNINQAKYDIASLLIEPGGVLIYHARDGKYHLKVACFPLNIIVSVTGKNKEGRTITKIINAGTAMKRKLSTLITEFRKNN